MLWLFRSCFEAPKKPVPPSLLDLVTEGNIEEVKACIAELRAQHKLNDALNPSEEELPIVRLFTRYNPEYLLGNYQFINFDRRSIINYNLVILLLKEGAKPGWYNSGTLTPYHIAAQYNHLSFFRLLIWFETEDMPYELAWTRGDLSKLTKLFDRWEFQHHGITRIIKQTAIDFREAKRCVKEAIRIERLNPLDAIKLYNKASDIFLLYMSKEDGADNPSKAPVVAFYQELADQYLAKARALRAAITDAVYDDPEPPMANPAQILNITTRLTESDTAPSVL